MCYHFPHFPHMCPSYVSSQLHVSCYLHTGVCVCVCGCGCVCGWVGMWATLAHDAEFSADLQGLHLIWSAKGVILPLGALCHGKREGGAERTHTKCLSNAHSVCNSSHQVHVLPTYPGSTLPPSCEILTTRIKCMCCPHTQVLHYHQAAESSLPASSACVAHISRFNITTKLQNPHYPHQVHVLPTYPGSTSPPSCEIPTTPRSCAPRFHC